MQVFADAMVNENAVGFVSVAPRLPWRRNLAARSRPSGDSSVLVCTQVASDLLVVGCGTLGSMVAEQWATGGGRVVGETRTNSRHAALKELGVEPCLRDDKRTESFPNVAFTASPSGNTEYAAEVKHALERWDKEAGGGFVFTSSAGVYSEEGGSVVRETGEVADRSQKPRSKVLLDAEDNVREAGGTVVRLAGLYTLTRGPHNFWISKGVVGSSPSGLINMLHYEDAASLVLAVLNLDGEAANGTTFLGCDGQTLTRADIVEAARCHPRYANSQPVVFESGDEDNLGRRYDNSWTRQVTGWNPKYKSMAEFFSTTAKQP